MGRTCCVIGCNVRSHDRQGKKMPNGVSFYCFPMWKQHEGSHVSDLKRRRTAWISAVRRTDINFSSIPRSLKVCSRHFHSGKPAYEMDETNPDWAPTLHLGHSEVRVKESDRHARRLRRRLSRARVGGDDHNESEALTEDRATEHVGEARTVGKAAEDEEGKDQAEMDIAENKQVDQAVVEAAEDEQAGQAVVEAADEEDGDQAEAEVAHEPAAKRPRTECQFCEHSRAEINHLLQENRELRSELNKRKMDEDFLKDNTGKTWFPEFLVWKDTYHSHVFQGPNNKVAVV
ncbi:hypothetical protein MATL_G00068350 [Megalops atlanticus]|uniref:THAP-type domain-containing protein n=1 Tax=Megalops atlanticus TaxID=7932 RepID=A0A9D3Q8A1_MEGAT|nr:hypothetical protein MATL_G00068350 [Megalops atlanticus]